MNTHVELNRLREYRRYIERKLTELREYAEWSALDDLVPEIDQIMAVSQRLVAGVTQIMESTLDCTTGHNPYEIVLDPDQ